MGESQHRGGDRISVEDYFDLRTWAKEFGVTAGDVRRAVRIVGDRAADVEEYLQRTGSEPSPGDAEQGSASPARPSVQELPARKSVHS